MFNRPPQKGPLWRAFLRLLDTRPWMLGLPLTKVMVWSITQHQEVLVSLPITARQLNALRALQRTLPELGELAMSITLAFDASRIDSPELARLILEKTCRRMVAGEPGSHDAMIEHLEIFGDLNCLSPQQVIKFTEQIRKLA